MEGKARGSAATVSCGGWDRSGWQARFRLARRGMHWMVRRGRLGGCLHGQEPHGSAGLEANGKVMDGSAPLGFAG
jgi:hypothetical protein